LDWIHVSNPVQSDPNQALLDSCFKIDVISQLRRSKSLSKWKSQMAF
jgi:hypothetical protein